jgi:hypothetical protein
MNNSELSNYYLHVKSFVLHRLLLSGQSIKDRNQQPLHHQVHLTVRLLRVLKQHLLSLLQRNQEHLPQKWKVLQMRRRIG